ncbi:MAG: AI-2E family transporter [Planctomycetota bacterium]
METPASAPVAAPAKVTTSKHEIVCWLLIALGIVFVLCHQLLSTLLAGLFVYALVHRITGRLTSVKVAGHKAKVAAIAIIGLGLTAISAGIVLAVVAVVRGRFGDYPAMLDKMTEVVGQFRVWFTAKGIGGWIPDAESIHFHAVNMLKEHSAELQQMGGASGKMFLHAIIGVVIGAMLSFHDSAPGGPLSTAFFERVRRFSKAFQQVFFAQVKISALNTVFTGIYLLLILPLFGVHLPFATTLVIVTFVAGLLPVIGNLVSNSVIAIISLSVGPSVAVASLVFLVVIHKLEYFLNARIVGDEINAAAWEILLAMVAFEAAFGIPGVIIAPIVYAYAKAELKDKQLI